MFDRISNNICPLCGSEANFLENEITLLMLRKSEKNDIIKGWEGTYSIYTVIIYCIAMDRQPRRDYLRYWKAV